ncbi:MAG: DUF6677 family protein [Planctomycetota bacterium]
MPRNSETTLRAIKAGVLSWLIPGAGHWALGHRGLAVVFFIAVSLPYWTGMAFGGIVPSASLRTNFWLVLAETGAGGYTIPCALASWRIEDRMLMQAGLPPWSRGTGNPLDWQNNPVDYTRYLREATKAGYMSYYPESDVAQIYLATAGLLNVLVILDAISRAQTGLPTYHRELRPAEQTGGTA